MKTSGWDTHDSDSMLGRSDDTLDHDERRR